VGEVQKPTPAHQSETTAVVKDVSDVMMVLMAVSAVERAVASALLKIGVPSSDATPIINFVPTPAFKHMYPYIAQDLLNADWPIYQPSPWLYI
jgi:hypothetical protein